MEVVKIKISELKTVELSAVSLNVEEESIIHEAVEGRERDENGPWMLWNGLQKHAGKKAIEANKKKPPVGPSESERLADVLTRYGNNSEGTPALQYAILQNDTAAVDLLLKHGASPQTKDAHGADCLYYSVKAGNIVLVKKFLGLGANPNGQVGVDQYKPLGLAIENQRNDIVTILLDNGIDLSRNSKYGADYLRYSCEFANFDAAKILLQRKATSNPEELLRALIFQNRSHKESLESRKRKIEMIDYFIRENIFDRSKKLEFANSEWELERLFPESLTYILSGDLLRPGTGRIRSSTLAILVSMSKEYATELVQIVIDRGIQVTDTDHRHEYWNMNILHFLVQGFFEDDTAFLKRKELIKQLIKLEVTINHDPGIGVRTPLTLAQDPKMIDFLKSIGAKYPG